MRQFLMFLLVAATATTVLAEPFDDLYIGGFVSQGYLNTSHNNYLVRDSRDGTSEYHEAAFNIQKIVDPRLRLGIQFFARDLGDQGNNNVLVDWAYADYQWRDYLGVRFGKFKTPQGLYGQGRDVDMLRPTVLLPQSVYNESLRDFIVGVEGFGIYGNVPMSDGGGLDYELYGGTINVPDVTSGFWSDIFEDVGRGGFDVPGVEPEGFENIEFLGVINPKVRFDYLYGGGLFWNSPLSKLRLGVTMLAARFEMESRMQYHIPGAEPGDVGDILDVPLKYEGDLSRAMVLSGEWAGDAVTLTGEYYQERVNHMTSEGYYFQASLQATSRTAWTGSFARYLRDRADGGGDRFVAMGYPDYVAWQNDYSVALRIDPQDHLVVKFEYHIIDGMGLLSLISNDLDDSDGYHRWWSFFAAKATVHF
jgi:hypothetical protein